MKYYFMSNRKISWQTFEEVYAKGLTRAIGVSNFEVKHLEAMEGLKPMVNQVTEGHYIQSFFFIKKKTLGELSVGE